MSTYTSLIALSLSAAVAATPLSTFHNSGTTYRTPLTPAPLVEEHHVHGSINNSYIVMLRDDLPASLVENHFNFLQMAHDKDPLAGELSGVQQVYTHHINGYAGRFTDSTVERLRRMPEVAYIERDQIVKTTEFAVHEVSEITKQKSAPWGLARVAHRNKLTFGTFSSYEYAASGGEGVDVYVVDTGINIDHVDFEGRASWGKTIPANDVDEDGNGHGSHCAGTIAGSKYGVAKKANVIAVKVLGSNGSGSMSDVVGGVSFAAASAKAKAELAALKGDKTHKGSVANMSLGGGKSPALDTAVNRAVDGGLHFAVAAGNDNKDACSYSPASAEKAVTVGASTLADGRAYFSNFGKCVDVFGPGLNIQSTYKGSPYAVATLSGTSMASPHVAGLLAYLLSVYPHATFDPKFRTFVPITLHSQNAFSIYEIAHMSLPTWISAYLPAPAFLAPVPEKPKTITTAQLKAALLDLASVDKLDDIGAGSPNLLIFNNATVA